MWPDRVVVIEAKYRSPNDRQAHAKGFPLYLTRPEIFAAAAADLVAAGYYELTRNWRIGAELGERLGRGFTLVNLGRRAAGASAGAFSKLLSQDTGRTFAFSTWDDVLGRAAPLPDWLESYSERRELLG